MILGVLGHIDHGKTSLIAALNGFWGDERADEKSRGITMDLSFSNLRGENGENIAFIDVPGHEDLVKNMIAGAFGMNAALLVVAVPDGVCAQSVEHLQIAYSLGIRKFLVALSKSDLADKNAFKAAELGVVELFSEIAPNAEYEIYPFSIKNEDQIKALKAAIFGLCAEFKQEKEQNAIISQSLQTPQRADFFRYYIDRAFAIKGAGCVVSGTILSGSIAQGGKVWHCGLEKSLQIKAIQVHNAPVSTAHIGQRAALNLAGVSHNELKRGDLLASKGFLRGFLEILCEVREFAAHRDSLAHNCEVSLFIGAAKFSAKVLKICEIEFGIESGIESKNTKYKQERRFFVCLKLSRAAFCVFGEPFILRSNSSTIAAGRVLAPICDPLKKAQKITLLNALYKNDFKSAFALLLNAHTRGFGLISAPQRFNLPQSAALNLAKEVAEFVSEQNLVAYSKKAVNAVCSVILGILKKNKNALLSSNLLAQKNSYIAPDFALFVLEKMAQNGELVRKDGFFVGLDFSQKNITEFAENALFSVICKAEFAPNAPYNLYDELDFDKELGNAALSALCRAKKIVRLNHKLYIESSALSKMLTIMRQIAQESGFVDLERLRTKTNLSRKYLTAYLDYLDNFEDIQKSDEKRYLRDFSKTNSK